MAENLSKVGYTFKRSDRNVEACGTVMRMRGGAIVAGELVRIDFTSGDDEINTDFTTIDLGTDSVASTVFASVVKVSAITAHDVVGVALTAAAEDELVRVEFAQGGIPAIVWVRSGAITTIGLAVTAAADASVDPATTTAKGKVLGRLLNPTTTADGDIVRMLFFGNAGLGFQESA